MHTPGPSFFLPGADVDESYQHTRDDNHPRTAEIRLFIERLWAQYQPYADRDFLKRSQIEFDARFWEMYLACTLLECRVPIIARQNRRFISRGPDLQMAPPYGWVEAVAVSAGVGEDAVNDGVCGKARSVPDDQIILRLLQGISAKLIAYDRYVRNTVVSTSDSYIIAVNPSAVPSAHSERDIPRIVRGLFPIGFEQFLIESSSLRVLESSHEYRGHITKSKGGEVPTTLFQDERSSGLSAVVYSVATPWNGPFKLGSDFVVVHNPLARNPWPLGTLKVGLEYWANGDSLHWRSWNRNPA
jgi:hypothetical protein